MDRLQMPSAMPAELAERLSDVAGPEYSPADLKEAREELAEKLLAGDRVDGSDLESLIDYEIDRNYAAFLRSLYEHFAGIGSCFSSAERCLAGDEWMLRLIDMHLDMDDEPVQERAAKIRADRDEDAKLWGDER